MAQVGIVMGSDSDLPVMSKAAEILEKDGLDVRVIDIHTIKPVDKDIIIEAARETRGIITAEEHSVIGGLGSAVAEVTSMYAPCKVIRVGQMDTFGESGKPTELMAKYGMDADEIVKKAREEFL